MTTPVDDRTGRFVLNDITGLVWIDDNNTDQEEERGQ